MIDYRESAAPTWFAGAAQRWSYRPPSNGPDLGIRSESADRGDRLVRGHILNCMKISPKSRAAIIYLRTCMPYAINQGICLNREYKPIGVAGKSGSNWVDYELFRSTHGVGDAAADSVWFYHDGNAPWCGGKSYTNYLYRVIHRFYPNALEQMK